MLSQMERSNNYSQPTPYEGEKVHVALCITAKAWETDNFSKAPTGAPTSKEGQILFRVADYVLQGDWACARKLIAKLPSHVLELIPDFAWNTIHLSEL